MCGGHKLDTNMPISHLKDIYVVFRRASFPGVFYLLYSLKNCIF